MKENDKKKLQLSPVAGSDLRQAMVQAGLDMTGPLGHVSGLTYRLVMSGDYADRTPQGYRNRRSGYLAPSIGWPEYVPLVVMSVKSSA